MIGITNVSKQEILDAFDMLYKDPDKERAHVHADKILCLSLKAAGLEYIADAFEKLDKWYA